MCHDLIDAATEELSRFDASREGMSQVWGGSKDQLEEYLLENILFPMCFGQTPDACRDAKHIENARAAVLAMHKSSGFNAQEMMARLGIKADLGNYKRI